MEEAPQWAKNGGREVATDRTLAILQMSLALCFRYQQADASDADTRERNVLRISITETPTETRWILQGRLSGPWPSELSAIWRTSTRTREGRACLVDLNDVTFIDKDAGDLLRTMSREGAEFLADGLYIKQVLEGLNISSASAGCPE